MIGALYATGVTGRILDSNSLVELLYMAYNRDEAEVFGLDRALAAGYDELYSTAPEVIEKKIAALDKEIEAKAISKAEDVVEKIRTERERKLEERKMKMEDIIDEMAKMIIKENEAYLGKEIVQESIDELSGIRQKRKIAKEKAEEEEEKVHEQKTVKKPRRRTTKTA